eukprot:JZ551029.1.p1 GENE.JZ551029.1~~JZ551029.1.p1  ORF type:complete len:210 (+),score=65.41 JZ551029.1:96-725(+)
MFKDKTFKAKSKHKEGTKRFELHKHSKATLGSGDLRAAVKLPDGEKLNDWLAVHCVDFYNQVNLLFGSIADFCTTEKCPSMTAGNKYEYLWSDGPKKKARQVPAREYVDLLMSWLEKLLNDESEFPTTPGSTYPKDFLNTVKTIFKRLFRVYAHIYYHHLQDIMDQGAEAHLNTCFKHYYFFVSEFQLVEKGELTPLKELIDNLIESSK